MKIIVTGGAGFIGRHLVRYLHDQALANGSSECQLLNLDKLTYASDETSLSELTSSPRYTFEQVDLCDADTVRRLVSEFAPDAIFHLAAESHVDRSIEGPGEFIQTNVIGTFNLLQAARSHFDSLDKVRSESFRFIHVSTDEVYGSLDFEQSGFTESSRYDPRSPYSASKAASDHLVRAWHHTYGLPVIVTNCSNNYGPEQYPEKLIPTVITRALAGEPIPVYGDGRNVRDWLYVGDHVTALAAVLQRGNVGETYNVGGNCERSNIDLVRKICEVLNQAAPSAKSYAEQISFVTDRPGHDLRYAMDTTKIENKLGWRPEMEFDAGLRKTILWYVGEAGSRQ